jgi:hypothetical protein
VVSAATAWHKGLGKGILLALVLLHVGAVLWYKVRQKQDLLPAMLHGDKVLTHEVPPSRDDARSRVVALLALLACAGLVRWVINLGAA